MAKPCILVVALILLPAAQMGSAVAVAEEAVTAPKLILVAGKNQKPRKAKASGLAGSEGDVRRKIMFPAGWEGGCQGVYKRYVAASGHSAFAATTIDYFYGGSFVCGAGINGPTQAEAERRALAQCDAGRKKYKGTRPSGRCTIYASK